MLRFFGFLLLSCLAALVSPARAASGELELRNWENASGITKVPVMKLRWNLSTFFQEPCEKYNFYYQSIDDFNRISNITLRAQVTAGGVAQDAYITAGPLVEEPGKWAWDVTGCGWWNQFFKSDSGAYIAEATARGFFKAGIGLTNLEVVEIEAEQSVNNDPEYQAFLDIVGEAYPFKTSGGAGAGSTVADARLPRGFRGGRRNNFWNRRVISPADARDYSFLRDQLTTSGSCLHYLDKFQWTYGGYEHVALRQGNGDHYLDDKQKITVHITLRYRGLATNDGRAVMRHIGSHRFSTRLGNGEGFVLVDRIRNPGGQALDVSVHMDCIKPGEEQQDPLEQARQPDPLETLLNQEKAARYDAEAARQQQRVAAVYDDNAAARERREEERRREAWRKWVASDEYKTQQRQKREAEQQRREAEKHRRQADERQRQDEQRQGDAPNKAAADSAAAKARAELDRELARVAGEIARGERLEPFEKRLYRWGYRDRESGRVKLEANFNSARPFSEGRAWVYIDDEERFALIDPDGRKLLRNIDAPVGLFQNGMALYRMGYDDHYIADRSGRRLAGPFHDIYNADPALKTRPFVFVQERKGPWSLYDRNAKKLFTFPRPGRPEAREDGIYLQTRQENLGGRQCSHSTERTHYQVYNYAGKYLRDHDETYSMDTPCIRLRRF